MGKQSDYTKCSLYTLNLLARYLDFPDYDAFCRSKRREIESRHFLVPTYSSSRFHVGDELSLEWVPECRLVVRYEGHLRFVVVSSENAPLCVNDTFECLSFIEGEALQLSNLEHGGQGPFVYVAGRMGGVHIVPAEEGEFTPPPHSRKPPVQTRQATELRTGRPPLPRTHKTCAAEPLRLFWLRQGGSVAHFQLEGLGARSDDFQLLRELRELASDMFKQPFEVGLSPHLQREVFAFFQLQIVVVVSEDVP